MSSIAETSAPSGVRKRRLPLSRLGVTPFFIFAILFLIWPTMYLIIGAFQDPAGNFTLQNIHDLFQPQIMSAYWVSIKVSLASAIGGAIIGFFLARAVVLGNLPSRLRPTVLTFSGVASNFAGVPLAFAFLATLGRTGFVTILLREWFGFNLYSTGFNLLSFFGLTLTYLFFQIPLMVLILTPALDGLKKRNGGKPHPFWVRPLRNTGAWWPSRSCGRACSARRFCCSRMPSGRLQQPTL